MEECGLSVWKYGKIGNVTEMKNNILWQKPGKILDFKPIRSKWQWVVTVALTAKDKQLQGRWKKKYHKISIFHALTLWEFVSLLDFSLCQRKDSRFVQTMKL